MATNTAQCGICDLRHLSKPSTDWCPECEEALCSDCKEHHSLSKATRGHKTIPVSDYHKLPPFISEIQQYCTEHNDKYQLFCQTHDCPLCIVCTKTHAKCIVIPLREVISNAKTSDILQDLLQSLKDLTTNIIGMKKDRQGNLDDIKKQKKKWVVEVQNLRLEINQHLDKLEKQIKVELDNVEKEACKNIKQTLATIDEKEKEISVCQTLMENIKNYASDLQTFLGMRQIESKVAENDKILQSLMNSNSLAQISITCTVATKMKDILTSVSTFGSVQLQTSPSSCVIVRKKEKQAQIMMNKNRRSINDIKLKMIKKIKVDAGIVRGCCLSPEGDLLFTDHCRSKLIVMNNDGSLKYKLPIDGSYVFDLTFIDEKTIAVTSGDTYRKPGVDSIDLSTRERTNFIKLPGRPYGITNSEKSLICCVENKDLHLLSCFDCSISTITNTILPDFSYVSTNGDRIYYTNNEQNTVTCCNFDGKPLWQFKEEKILLEPRGIAVDNNGNAYVAGQRTSNVVLISADGQQHKEVLGRDDGLVDPSSLFFDSSESQLLVANCNKDHCAFLYTVL